MTGLAQILRTDGHEVGGSLGEPTARDPGLAERLRKLGLRLDPAPGPSRGPRAPHALIFAPNAPPTHPDRLRAARLGIEQEDLARALDRAIAGCAERVLVAGRSRRPRSVAARLGWALLSAGADPRVLLAHAAAPQLGGFARAGEGRLAVAEAVPMPPGLWAPTRPTTLALCRGADRLGWRALRPLVEDLPADALLLAESPLLADAPGWLRDRPGVQSFGLRGPCDWKATDLKPRGDRIRARIFHRGIFVREVDLDATGTRGVADALAACALFLHLGGDEADLGPALESFRGLDRQVERLGQYRGVAVVDDQAETPRAARRAAAFCRRAYPGRRLVVLADLPGRPSLGAGEADLIVPLAGNGAGPAPPADLETLDRLVEPGDVLLTLGSSTVRNLADAFLRRLPRAGANR